MLKIKQFTFNPFAENTYLLYGENKDACIIDPGCQSKEEIDELTEWISRNGLNVKYILLTHAHLDHIFGLKWCAETFQLTPWMHPAEQPVLESGPRTATMYGQVFAAYKGAINPLSEGQEIRLQNDVLDVLYAPGHSPGHVCFYVKNQQFVIGGDVLFQHSIGRTDLPGGSHNQLINSIRQKLFTLPDDTIVYSGHGPSTTIGEEKKFNPFLQ